VEEKADSVENSPQLGAPMRIDSVKWLHQFAREAQPRVEHHGAERRLKIHCIGGGPRRSTGGAPERDRGV
jgi:hypothetical protein